jgi:small nuclear ribonucleoprotein (snRNP)-like protein
MTSKKQTPSDFLKQIIGRPVVVKLNSGVGKKIYFSELEITKFYI